LSRGKPRGIKPDFRITPLLEEKGRLNVSTDGITEMMDLFAKILINAVKILNHS
jgi:hypothetical protein